MLTTSAGFHHDFITCLGKRIRLCEWAATGQSVCGCVCGIQTGGRLWRGIHYDRKNNGMQGMTRASLITTDLPQRRRVGGRKRQGLPRKNPACVGIMDEASERIMSYANKHHKHQTLAIKCVSSLSLGPPYLESKGSSELRQKRASCCPWAYQCTSAGGWSK